MGGAVVSREAFPGRAAYEEWTIECVRSKIAELIEVNGAIAMQKADRSHYFNAFNNYEYQNPRTGAFMTLPMEHFGKYIKSSDGKAKDGSQFIYMRRPLSMLVLLCDVEGVEGAQARLAMLMELASATGSRERLNRGELATLLADMAEGLHSIGIMAQQPKAKDLEDMTAMVWARAEMEVKAETLDVKHFWRLCQKDFSKHGLLFAMLRGDFRASMRVVRNSGDYVKKGPKALDADTSSSRYQRARARYSIRQVRNKSEKAAGERIDVMLSEGKHADMASYELRQDVKNRKKKLNAVATTKAMTDLMIATGVEFRHVLELREQFFKMQESTPQPYGMHHRVITMEQLTDILCARIPNLEDGRVLQRAIRVFDVDHDGRIDFDEFAIGMARFLPSEDVRGQLGYIFSLYDINGDGNVELWEVTDVLEDHEDDLGNMYDHCLKVNWMLDLNGDGKITTHEFQKVMATEKIYVNYCWNSLPPLHPSIKAAVECLVEVYDAAVLDTPRDAVRVGVAPTPAFAPGHDLSKPEELTGEELVIEEKDANLKPGKNAAMIRIWLEAYIEFTLLDAADVVNTLEILQSRLGLSGGMANAAGVTVAEAVEAIYVILKKETDSPVHPVQPRQMWAAVGKALSDSYADKARILYKLIDDDADEDDGSVNLTEVTRYIHQVKANYDKLVTYTIDHFDDLDADGDGIVTHDELIDRVLDDPRLLQLFSLIFFF